MPVLRIVFVRARWGLRIHSEAREIELLKPYAAGVITHHGVAPDQMKELLPGLLPRQITVAVRQASEQVLLLLCRELGEVVALLLVRLTVRSEERRVGKEWRSWEAQGAHQKNHRRACK